MLRAVSPLELPGLPFTGPDPAARRRAVREASDDDLVEACVSLARSLREPDLAPLARAAGLPIAGLMCIPPAGVDAAPYFALLAKIAREEGVAGLSMGMSDDVDTAVTLGATHVRVGSALFGARA